MVDHVELNTAQVCEHFHWDLQIDHRLLVSTIELALDIEIAITTSILRDLDSIWLNVPHIRQRELFLDLGQASDLKAFENGIVGTIGVNTLQKNILTILTQRDLESVVSTEVRNRNLKLRHEKLNDFINSLMNAQVSLTIHLSLLEIDNYNLSSILLSSERHETSGWDSHTGAHANSKVGLRVD